MIQDTPNAMELQFLFNPLIVFIALVAAFTRFLLLVIVMLRSR